MHQLSLNRAREGHVNFRPTSKAVMLCLKVVKLVKKPSFFVARPASNSLFWYSVSTVRKTGSNIHPFHVESMNVQVDATILWSMKFAECKGLYRLLIKRCKAQAVLANNASLLKATLCHRYTYNPFTNQLMMDWSNHDLFPSRICCPTKSVI